MPRPFFVAFLGLTLLACVTDEGPGIPAASGGSGGSSGSAGMSGSTSGSSGSGGIAGTAGTAGSGGSTSGTAGTSGSAGAGGTGGTAGSGGSAATAGTGANAGTGGTGGLPPECTPGVDQGCTCSNGSNGFRTCLPDSQWGPCGPCNGGNAGTGTCGDGPQQPIAIVDWCSPLNGPDDLSANGSDSLCDSACGYYPYAFTCQTDGTAPGADCQVRDINSNVSCCATAKCFDFGNACPTPNPPNSFSCYYGAAPPGQNCIEMQDYGTFSYYCCD